MSTGNVKQGVRCARACKAPDCSCLIVLDQSSLAIAQSHLHRRRPCVSCTLLKHNIRSMSISPQSLNGRTFCIFHHQQTFLPRPSHFSLPHSSFSPSDYTTHKRYLLQTQCRIPPSSLCTHPVALLLFSDSATSPVPLIVSCDGHRRQLTSSERRYSWPDCRPRRPRSYTGTKGAAREEDGSGQVSTGEARRAIFYLTAFVAAATNTTTIADAVSSRPTVSPTDQHDSPTTRKLKHVKERRFAPGAKGKTPAMQRMAGLVDENSPPS